MIVRDEESGMLFMYHCPWCSEVLLACPAEACRGLLHHPAGDSCQAATTYSFVNDLAENSIHSHIAVRTFLSAEEVVSVYELPMEAEWSGEAYGQGKLSVTRHLRTMEGL